MLGLKPLLLLFEQLSLLPLLCGLLQLELLLQTSGVLFQGLDLFGMRSLLL